MAIAESPAPDSAAPAAFRPRALEVYEQVKQDIGEFRLVPGDRFTEGQIAGRLGVSRTPVRQALYRLRQEGFVEVLFRSGWRVLPFDFEQFDQLYELRLVLELAAVQRLCEAGRRIDNDKVQALAERWLAPPSARSTDGAQVAMWDESFHCDLVAAAGNAAMAEVHQDVTGRIRMIRSLDFSRPARVEATYEEHAKILAAILASRGDQAAMLLRAHVESSRAEVHKITLHQVHMARRAAPAQG